MKKIHILVEGQTESEFVAEVLQPYFSKSAYMKPVLAKTKRAIGGSPAFKGGIVSYGKFEFDVKQLLRDSSAMLVTTMIDFYRLPTDFPGLGEKKAQSGTVIDRVTYLESKMAESINNRRFLPYIAIHEFEALLFCDPERIVEEIRGDDVSLKTKLKEIRQAYDTPEDINEKLPPSKRILDHIKEYQKTVHGLLVAVDIGIDKMREECPHFNTWLTAIESHL